MSEGVYCPKCGGMIGPCTGFPEGCKTDTKKVRGAMARKMSAEMTLPNYDDEKIGKARNEGIAEGRAQAIAETHDDYHAAKSRGIAEGRAIERAAGKAKADRLMMIADKHGYAALFYAELDHHDDGDLLAQRDREIAARALEEAADAMYKVQPNWSACRWLRERAAAIRKGGEWKEK